MPKIYSSYIQEEYPELNMDHWLMICMICVMTGVFDEPMNLSPLAWYVRCWLYVTGQNGHFAIENGTHTHKVSCMTFDLDLMTPKLFFASKSYFIEENRTVVFASNEPCDLYFEIRLNRTGWQVWQEGHQSVLHITRSRAVFALHNEPCAPLTFDLTPKSNQFIGSASTYMTKVW